MNLDNYWHSVKGIRKSDGILELIAPDISLKESKFFCFSLGYEKIPKTKLEKLEAVEIAKKAIASGNYQDVYVLRDNGEDGQGNLLCCTVVYFNGRWINLTTEEPFLSGKAETINEKQKRKTPRKKSLKTRVV